MVDKLSNTRAIREKNFKEIVYSEDHDVLLLVYSSEKNASTWKK